MTLKVSIVSIANVVTLLDLAFLSLSVHSLSAQSQAQVQIHVTDAYGMAVPASRIRVMGASMIDAVQDKIIALPYGRYTVEVLVPGFALTTVSAAVDQPAQIITVGMRVGDMEAQTSPTACTILGRFSPEVQAVRVRAIQLFGSYTTDVPITTEGSFEVRNLECGDYLLIAMGPSKFLGTVVARASLKPQRIEMKLAKQTIFLHRLSKNRHFARIRT